MNYVKHLCNYDNTNDVQFIHVGETSVDQTGKTDKIKQVKQVIFI
jgi:hypothetical protein